MSSSEAAHATGYPKTQAPNRSTGGWAQDTCGAHPNLMRYRSLFPSWRAMLTARSCIASLSRCARSSWSPVHFLEATNIPSICSCHSLMQHSSFECAALRRCATRRACLRQQNSWQQSTRSKIPTTPWMTRVTRRRRRKCVSVRRAPTQFGGLELKEYTDLEHFLDEQLGEEICWPKWPPTLDSTQPPQLQGIHSCLDELEYSVEPCADPLCCHSPNACTVVSLSNLEPFIDRRTFPQPSHGECRFRHPAPSSECRHLLRHPST
mmetsp:Transcript_65538/g.158023  ORF Transcript_65538/g.158023 Transcript_65538/m.158023 type:complete len:264 (-) Transcript_65538:154-945(-)